MAYNWPHLWPFKSRLCATDNNYAISDSPMTQEAIKVQCATASLVMFLVLKPIQISLIYQWASLAHQSIILKFSVCHFHQCTFKNVLDGKILFQVGLNPHLQLRQLLCKLLTLKSKSYYVKSITEKRLNWNFKKTNRDHKKIPKQDEDTGNLQILLHIRSLFDCCYLKNLVKLANVITCSQNRDLKCNIICKLPVSSSCLGTFYDPYSSFLNYKF